MVAAGRGTAGSWPLASSLTIFSLVARVVFDSVEASTETKRWICEACGWIYDPAEGDVDGGVPPGTAFEDIPEDWFCPVCGARKEDFAPYED